MVIGRKNILLISVLFLTFMVCSFVSTAYAKDSSTIETEQVEIVVADINSSSAEELQMVSGIGPTLASRIIKYRDENGKFETIEDIMKVKGVGRSKFEKIKEHLKV